MPGSLRHANSKILNAKLKSTIGKVPGVLSGVPMVSDTINIGDMMNEVQGFDNY